MLFFSVHLSTSCCVTGIVGMATECWTNSQGRFSKCIKVTIFLPSSVLVTSHKFLPGGIKLSLIMNSLKFQIFYLNTLLWKFLNICKGSKNRTMNPMFPLFKLQQLATFCWSYFICPFHTLRNFVFLISFLLCGLGILFPWLRVEPVPP